MKPDPRLIVRRTKAGTDKNGQFASVEFASEQTSVAETELAMGYQSASGFSTAFSREIFGNASTLRAPKIS